MHLAKRYGINEKTVLKWHHRQSVEDMSMGPKERRSTVLSPMEEAAIVALRVQVRLPLDDVYIALKDVPPQLTRASLHRCLQRHGISRLPKADREKPKRFKDYEIGCFHIDIAELRYEGGKVFIYVTVDFTSRLIFARIYRRATRLIAAGFLKALIWWVPYKIHTILTGNGVRFVQRERSAKGLTFPYIFGHVCLENNIEHRLTRPYHPWTNGQAGRMVRTIKEATVQSFHYASIQELRRHVSDWLIAYNLTRQLKAIKFRTPCGAIEELWKSKPDAFIVKPNHHMPGPNN